jgi:hypothetical protein
MLLQLPVGLECHKWYQTVRKQCQFSFEELLCSLLSEHNEVELLPMHCQLLKQLIDEDQLLASKARDTYVCISMDVFGVLKIEISLRDA